MNTGITTETGTEEMSIPEEIYDIDITTEYIPAGMQWTDERHLQYTENKWYGGMTFASALLDNNSLEEVMQDKNVIESEERTFGKYDGVYLRYADFEEDGSYNQRIYLLCPDVYRVITIYIGDNVDKEEAIKVVENLEITENSTLLETADMRTWSEVVSEAISADEEITSDTSIAEDELPIHQVGESFDISAWSCDSDGNTLEDAQISVCVDSVQISDNLDLLNQNALPESWVDAVGSDGKLKDNTLSYMKSGNGIDTLNEVVKTETVKQKLVYATVTYTNNSDTEMYDLLYHGSISLMEYTDGTYQIYDPAEQSGDGYDYITWDGAAGYADMQYCYNASGTSENEKNYISCLKPGESVQVNMVWIVNENDMDSMYLDLSGLGSFVDASVIKSGAAVVDIRQ